MFYGFQTHTMHREGVRLHTRVAGEGPPPLPEALIASDPERDVRSVMGGRHVGIDLDHDRTDVAAGRRLAQPLRVLWGEHGAVGRCFDVLSLWRQRADHITGQSLPCGHYLAEELPDRVIAEALTFFASI
jgi:haloacetate dehalogenase